MYRFRSTQKLFELKELEEQIIYFAHPDQLNDPLEGHRELIWKGDYIQWKALFSHYLLCFDWVYSAYLLKVSDMVITSQYIPSFMSEIELPTDNYRKRIKRTKDKLFESKKIEKILNHLGSLKSYVSKYELEYYLKFIQPTIIEMINSESNLKQNYSSDIAVTSSNMLDKLCNALEILNQSDDSLLFNDNRRDLFKIFSNTSMQLELIQLYNSKSENVNFRFMFFDFAKEYLNKLGTLVYPDWYVACFMEESRNSALWGYYGDNHAGICLKFKMEHDGNVNYINLQDPTQNYRISKFALHKVSYQSDVVQINVFNSLGRLSLKKIHDQWMSDGEKVSAAYAPFANNLKSWRVDYYKKYVESITNKTHDWATEREYRIFIDDTFSSYSESSSRRFKYDFNDLECIIFGVNTKRDDKLRIMKIIEEKCQINKRNDFMFYQAYCDNDKIEYEKLDLLT